MKKCFAISTCICFAMIVTSCSITSESAYKAAYEQAKYQETVRPTQQKLTNKKNSKSSPSKGNCWSCHGAGKIMGMPCSSCGGTGTMNVSFDYDPNKVVVNPNDGYIGEGGKKRNDDVNPSGSHQCRVCNGTGSEIYEPYTGSGRSVYCNTCRRTFSHAHAHRPCKICNGTGRVTY